MGKVFNMVGGGSGSITPDLPIGSYINVTSDIGATIQCKKGSLEYTKSITSRLPSEYQEVEYIESHGTEHINMGVGFGSTKKLKYKIINVTYQQDYWLYGIYYSPSNTFGASQVNSKITFGVGSTRLDGLNIDNKDVEVSSSKYSIDGVETQYSYSGTIPSDNMPLFGLYYNGAITYKTAIKLFYFQIFDNDTLIRDFIPCYRKSDSVIGLYDTVNNVFYDNDGTGTFDKGSDITQGTVSFEIHHSGTWNLTANKTGETELTDSVVVSADDTDYPVSMVWRLYIIRDGVELVPMQYDIFSGRVTTVTSQTGYIEYKSPSGSGSGKLALVDTTPYSNLKIKYSLTRSGSGTVKSGIYIMPSYNYTSGTAIVSSALAILGVTSGSTSLDTYNIPLSGISGEKYLGCYLPTDSAYTSTVCNIYDMWLE